MTMGEAKRRKMRPGPMTLDEALRANDGQPVNMWLFDYPPPRTIVLPSFEECQRDPVKWARLIALNRIAAIANGEAWPCVLCSKSFSAAAHWRRSR
jgi:hypothetical protein